MICRETKHVQNSLFGTSYHHNSACQSVSGVPHDSDEDPRWQRPNTTEPAMDHQTAQDQKNGISTRKRIIFHHSKKYDQH